MMEMNVTVAGKSHRHDYSSDDTSPSKKGEYKGADVNGLPSELVVKILSNLNDPVDFAVCRRVNRQWKELVDGFHLQSCAFYRSCHPLKQSPGWQTAEHYHSFIQSWLKNFSDEGKELAAQLDPIVGDKHFAEILFTSISRVLGNAKVFQCQPEATIRHTTLLTNTVAPLKSGGALMGIGRKRQSYGIMSP